MANAEGNPFVTLLLVGGVPSPPASRRRRSHDWSRGRIAANERARVVARLNSVLDPSLRGRDLTTTRLGVTDLELLGSDDPVDVFVLSEAGEPVASVIRERRAARLQRRDQLADRRVADRHRHRRARRRHRETSGLGDAIDAAKSDWIEQFTARRSRPGRRALGRRAGRRRVRLDHGRHGDLARRRHAPSRTRCYTSSNTATSSMRGGRSSRSRRRRRSDELTSLREATAGLWRNNVTLVQLLGLCPLLAVSTSFVNGLALGVATTIVLVVANTAMSLLRRVLVPAVRIPLYLLLLAALVTSLDLLTHAVLYDLHEALGLFIPLIVVNCGLLAHAETVASRRPVGFVAGLGAGDGVRLLVRAHGARGAARALGHGTLLARRRDAGRRRRYRDQASTCRSTACSSRFCRPARSSAWRCCSRCAIGSTPRSGAATGSAGARRRRRGERGAAPQDLRTFCRRQPGSPRPSSSIRRRSSCSWPSCCRHKPRTSASTRPRPSCSPSPTRRPRFSRSARKA